jgi:phosphoribosylformimino-5-aminoimidazole carboxamide ribonucleotide (ProFAR) isomerase
MSIVTVAETPEFQRRARALMSDEERMALIDFIARNPTAGVSIGGGIRKSALPAMVAARAADIGSFTFSAAKRPCRFS